MKLYNLDSVLTFGQYKGETVLEILKKNSTYITNYCLNESQDFCITDQVFLYSWKQDIDSAVKEGVDLSEAIQICMNADPNKKIFEEKRAEYKNYRLNKCAEMIEAELSGKLIDTDNDHF